ncbi:MAG TPA: glycosyltransferase family 4 protein [Thermoleophilaceae bacterium]
MTDGALRPALLAPSFFPEVRRGGERIVRELADELVAHGHRPWLITSHPGRPSHTVEDGLEVTRNWRPPAGRLRRREVEDHLTHVPLSYLTLVRGQAALSHATYPTDALASTRWSARTGRPSILTYLGVPHRRGIATRRHRAEILLRAVRGSDAVTVLSRTAADAMRRWVGAEARVIHPGVKLDAFAPGGVRDEVPTIACLADPTAENKRVPLLVEAFLRLRRDRPDARLLLMRPDDPVLAARLAAPDGVELVSPGWRPEAVAEVYRRAWITALPSWGESFGIVLVESLACGTPVVGSDLGAIPEVVDSESVGRLFSGDSPEAVARALAEALELAADPGTATACRAHAERFSTQRMGEEYLALYRELLER